MGVGKIFGGCVEILASYEAILEDLTLKALEIRSFKEALSNRRLNERAFDDDLDHLSMDDDEFGVEDLGEDLNLDKEPDFGVPRIKLPQNLLNKIRRPWKDCLIVKPLGMNIGYKLLISKLRKTWDLQGDFEAIDLGIGFFLIKFQMKDDCAKLW
ncbi:hypothetical protein LOK49_Contig323G00003 [Camellia lanceoleosa]|nr:hypothetical protein LOK49_Contig323G00003 [Camellia lanceoleosa]